MKTILANYSANISDLKKNHSALIDKSEGEPIARLNHNRPTAYLVPAETYEALIEKLEDCQLGLLVNERYNEKVEAVAVEIDKL